MEEQPYRDFRKFNMTTATTAETEYKRRKRRFGRKDASSNQCTSGWLLGQLALEFDRAADHLNDKLGTGYIESADSGSDCFTIEEREKEIEQVGSFSFSHRVTADIVSHVSETSFESNDNQNCLIM